MRLYYLLGRLTGPLQSLFFTVYNKLFHVPRSRVIIQNEDDKILLVRNWGGRRQWQLPGGGVERGEDTRQAAQRETFEELGLAVPLDRFRYIDTLYNQYVAPIYTITIQTGDLPETPHNPWEITTLQWFSPHELPPEVSPIARLAIEKFLE